MRIAYTVCGDGYGHAFRSSVVIDHLLNRGHEVAILASLKAYDYLSSRYQDVTRISGLKMVYQDNQVKRGQTVLKNIISVKNLPNNIKTVRRLLKNRPPQVVISDFEPLATLIAAIYNVPLISLDNNHVISDTKIKPKAEDYTYYLVSRLVVDAILPNRDYSFITTFFYPPLKKKHRQYTYLVPPLIRPEISSVKPQSGDYILVYQTSDSYRELLNILKNSREKFVIYNGNRALAASNLTFRDFSPQSMVQDLAGAKGVIANGGFTFISESLYLGKPVLSIPIKRQYEQILNGRMIEALGYGRMAFRLTKPVLEDWLKNLTDYRRKISELQFDNDSLFNKLDSLLIKLRDRSNGA